MTLDSLASLRHRAAMRQQGSAVVCTLERGWEQCPSLSAAVLLLSRQGIVNAGGRGGQHFLLQKNKGHQTSTWANILVSEAGHSRCRGPHCSGRCSEQLCPWVLGSPGSLQTGFLSASFSELE